jgi:regulator of sigma E protease
MNAVLPIILFTILFMIPQDVQVGDVVVTEVVPGSPADAAGVQARDIILRADGQEIETAPDLIRAISLNAGSEMQWLVERGGAQEIIRVTPRRNPPPDEGATGIGIDLINDRI